MPEDLTDGGVEEEPGVPSGVEQNGLLGCFASVEGTGCESLRHSNCEGWTLGGTMLDARPEDRARYRFAGDLLPVSRQAVVVMRPVGDSDGLELTNGATVFMSLDEDASLRDAEELAETLNDRVRELGYISAG